MEPKNPREDRALSRQRIKALFLFYFSGKSIAAGLNLSTSSSTAPMVIKKPHMAGGVRSDGLLANSHQNMPAVTPGAISAKAHWVPTNHPKKKVTTIKKAPQHGPQIYCQNA